VDVQFWNVASCGNSLSGGLKLSFAQAVHADKRAVIDRVVTDPSHLEKVFRLYLHAAAHNLLVRLRQAIVRPFQQSSSSEIPTEALSGQDGRRYENDRRRKDPLGESHRCTWRTRLSKVAADILVRTRRIHVKVSGSWSFLDFYDSVSRIVTGRPSLRAPD